MRGIIPLLLVASILAVSGCVSQFPASFVPTPGQGGDLVAKAGQVAWVPVVDATVSGRCQLLDVHSTSLLMLNPPSEFTGEDKLNRDESFIELAVTSVDDLANSGQVGIKDRRGIKLGKIEKEFLDRNVPAGEFHLVSIGPGQFFGVDGTCTVRHHLDFTEPVEEVPDPIPEPVPKTRDCGNGIVVLENENCPTIFDTIIAPETGVVDAEVVEAPGFFDNIRSFFRNLPLIGAFFG